MVFSCLTSITFFFSFDFQLEVDLKRLCIYSDFKLSFSFHLIQMIKARLHKILNKSYYIPMFSWNDMVHEQENES